MSRIHPCNNFRQYRTDTPDRGTNNAVEIWPSRIREDLSGLFRGTLDVSPVASSLYSQDGGVGRETPGGVALPEDVEDLEVLMQYCHEHRIPVTARGSGTSIFGQSLGSGLIIDFSARMHRVLSMGERTVRVEPGVTIDELNRRLRPYGREFGILPLDSPVATVGGVVALDASGSHGLRHGAAHDHIASMQVMLARGTQLMAGLEPLAMPAGHAAENATHQVKRTIVCRLESILREQAALIKTCQPGTTPLRRGGYQLRGVLTDERLDLCRLLVGSEGTLGLYTGLTLHTVPLPPHRGVLLLLCPSLDSAIEAVHHARQLEPAACDLVDRRVLTLARELDDRFLMIIPPTIEAAVLLEVVADSETECRSQLTRLRKCVAHIAEGHLTAYEANSPSDVEFLWSLARRILPRLEQPRGGMRTVRIFDDLVVPPEALAEFLTKAHKSFQVADLSTVMYSHAGTGVVHFRPLLSAREPWPLATLEQLQQSLFELVWSLGGSLGSTQGLGAHRTNALREQYGPLCDVFSQIKEIFDPQKLLGVGHVVPGNSRVGSGSSAGGTGSPIRSIDRPHLAGVELKLLATDEEQPAAPPTGELVELQYSWSPEEAAQVASSCNGCGECRREDRGHRMCPFFHIDRKEARSPRAKATIFRDVLSGRLSPDELTRPEMRPVLDSCFNCQQCAAECPSSVDIPRMAVELKAQAAVQQGVSRVDWLLSRPDVWGPWGTWLAPVLNTLLNWRIFRRVLELTIGVAKDRRLPLFAKQSFLRQGSEKWKDPHESGIEEPSSPSETLKIVYFTDHFANYHDPELATAWCRVAEHVGLTVRVPDGQLASGMALVSAGELSAARELAMENVRILSRFAREGYRIVCTEPTAALCLKNEYPRLTGHPDATLVAQQTIEAGALLGELASRGELPTHFEPLAMTPLRAVYHTPCHLKVLGDKLPLLEICRLIPQLELHAVERGCSGMAGTFGLSRKNFNTSMKIGHDLMETMRSREWDFGITECSGCRLQMLQRSTTPTLHPIKLLAIAYGLMPELKARFKHQSKKYTID